MTGRPLLVVVVGRVLARPPPLLIVVEGVEGVRPLDGLGRGGAALVCGGGNETKLLVKGILKQLVTIRQTMSQLS